MSIPFWTEHWKPDSFYDKIMKNRELSINQLSFESKEKNNCEKNINLIILNETKNVVC